MYTVTNYKTKKALKQAVADGNEVLVYQPGPFGNLAPNDGAITLEGPHFPKSHTWYATATVKDGIIVEGTVR